MDGFWRSRLRTLSLLCLLLSFALPAKTLVIGGMLEPPLKYLDAQQTPAGMDVELLTEIFTALKVPIRIELTDSGARLTRNAKMGEYDLLMSLSYKAERDSYLLYPTQAHIRHSWHFFVRKQDKDRIRYRVLSDLKPWRIGITKDYAYTLNSVRPCMIRRTTSRRSPQPAAVAQAGRRPDRSGAHVSGQRLWPDPGGAPGRERRLFAPTTQRQPLLSRLVQGAGR